MDPVQHNPRRLPALLTVAAATLLLVATATASDPIRALQSKAVEAGRSPVAHWGWDSDNYLLWGTHSNRLIPVYTFGTAKAGTGIDLRDYMGKNSPYRSPSTLRKLYGTVPSETFNSSAEYLDQTNIYDIQRAALAAGRKQIILIVFDGMDWQTTQAASIARLGRVAYDSGRGTGLHFQDYKANETTQFGYMVTSPYADGTRVNVNSQTVETPNGEQRGGYSATHAGSTPWAVPEDDQYLIGKSDDVGARHAYTDSASSATSMTAGIKTYNNAINVDPLGTPVPTIAHTAQRRGYGIGVVTSVPISHATPAAAYAHNVHRNDYQDLTRDLLGLPSISHPDAPLPGVDVLLGAGFGELRPLDNGQGKNFVAGNAYLTTEDRHRVDVRQGGEYVVVERTAGVLGRELLRDATDEAVAGGHRLFGFFGVAGGHLPYQTADGDFNPAVGRRKAAETYSKADVQENPTLAEMTSSALTVLSSTRERFWMLVEAGDVDWANHDNNIDNSIGAVFSGDAAVRVVTDWVEQNSSWDDAIVIVTADHGHLLVLDQPHALAKLGSETEATSASE